MLEIELASQNEFITSQTPHSQRSSYPCMVVGMKRLLALTALLASCSLMSHRESDVEQHFLTQVKPMLEQQCLRCHNGTVPPPALNLSNKALAFQRSRSGLDFIVPGDPAHSQLIVAVQRGGKHPKSMPRGDDVLANDQVSMLRDWIVDGAYWPEGKDGALHSQMAGAQH